VTAGTQYIRNRIVKHLPVFVFDSEIRVNPGFVQLTECGFVSGLERAIQNVLSSGLEQLRFMSSLLFIRDTLIQI
jgi:hypothetical protein